MATKKNAPKAAKGKAAVPAKKKPDTLKKETKTAVKKTAAQTSVKTVTKSAKPVAKAIKSVAKSTKAVAPISKPAVKAPAKATAKSLKPVSKVSESVAKSTKPVAKATKPAAKVSVKAAAKSAKPVAKASNPVAKATKTTAKTPVKAATKSAKPEEKSSRPMAKPAHSESNQVAGKTPSRPAVATASAGKKLCRIISYDKMTPEIKALFDARYPDGYTDAVMRYPKPSGESFYAVGLYTKDADYLIKVDVDVDMSALDEDYGSEEANMEEVEGESSNDGQGSPDVNDLADSLADETSDPV